MEEEQLIKINRVWFVSHYSMPPKYEPRVKTLRLAHYLGLNGIDCTIFSASTLHNTNINLITDKKIYIERKYDDLKFVHIRCSDYQKTDIKRIINMEQFAYRFSTVAKNFTLPDIVVTDTYCIAYKPIFDFCKKYHIKIVLDVRDLWPQSIVEYLGFNEKNPIIQFMYAMEKHMYMKADKIVFSFAGGYDYIKDRHLDKIISHNKVFYLNNGVDLQQYRKNALNYQIKDPDLENKDIIKIVYTGSIRRVNNIGLLLDIAKQITLEDIVFLIWGDGDELEDLKQRINNEKISNVVFKGRVEKKYIPYITSKADVNLIHNNPSNIFKYGISFNKIFDYFAAGKPTLTTFTCKYNPAIIENTGIEIKSRNPSIMAKRIEDFTRQDFTVYCNNSMKAAEKYDYKVLANQFIDILEK